MWSFLTIHKLPDSMGLGLIIETLNPTQKYQDWCIQLAFVLGHYTLKVGLVISTNKKE